MFELLIGILFAAGATYYVLIPILRPRGGGRPETAGGADLSAGEGDDPDDDWSTQTVALRALKEIEFDRATGKLGDTDYAALKAKYTAEALEAMRGERPGSGKREAGSAKPAHPVSRIPHPACPQHGPRPEKDAVFCSECGRRLGTAPAYCARCGTALSGDARYCERCGARVAA